MIESYPAVSPERAQRIALVAGAGADNRIFLGAFLELLLIIANIGTAVVLYPILKRRSEILRELSLGLRLTFKGFLPSPVLSARGQGT